MSSKILILSHPSPLTKGHTLITFAENFQFFHQMDKFTCVNFFLQIQSVMKTMKSSEKTDSVTCYIKLEPFKNINSKNQPNSRLVAHLLPRSPKDFDPPDSLYDLLSKNQHNLQFPRPDHDPLASIYVPSISLDASPSLKYELNEKEIINYNSDSKEFYFGKWVDDRKSTIFFETEHFVSTVNPKPVADGHSMLISKKILPSFINVPFDDIPDMVDNLLVMLNVVSRFDYGFLWDQKNINNMDVNTKKQEPSYLVAIQDGPLAGQTVKHLHFHVIKDASILPDSMRKYRTNDDMKLEVEKKKTILRDLLTFGDNSYGKSLPEAPQETVQESVTKT